MGRMKYGALAVLVVAAVFAAMAAVASAEITLTEFTVETTASSNQKVTSTFKNPGKGLLEGEIKSTELTSEMSPTNKKEGTFHIDFKKSECKALVSGKANSKGDAEGVILVLGKYKIVGVKGTSADAVLELEPVTIECAGLTIEVSGSVIGSLSPTGKSTKEFALTVKESSNKQEITEYEKDNGEKVKAELTTTVDKSSGPSWQNENEAVTITTEKETELT